jgi:predicted metal-binding membrane protein
MLMLGGWTMSMAWMLMPGQTWPQAASSFLGMWIVMMMAMMLPSVTVMLMRYRRNLAHSHEPHPEKLTAVVGVAYFAAWIALGVIVYASGSLLAEIEMQHAMLARAIPFLAALCILVAGVVQFTPWKAHHLACCRAAQESETLKADIPTAWRQGLSFGFHCCCCCLNLTAILLVVGIMDLRAMTIITAAITLERLAPTGEAAARITGASALGLGTILLLQALQAI